jgi:hypothetical protein
VNHSRRDLEVGGLHKTGRGGLLRGELQQPQQPCILRPQPRQLSRDRCRDISHAHNLSAVPDVQASKAAHLYAVTD